MSERNRKPPFRKKPDFKRDRRDRPPPGRQPGHAAARAADPDTAILYGWHTVEAALANPKRRIRALYATENAAKRLSADGIARTLTTRGVDAVVQEDVGALVGEIASRARPGDVVLVMSNGDFGGIWGKLLERLAR